MNRSFLSGLNPTQLAAVESTSTIIIINAGPGTGKTKTLISRMVYLILERKVDPSSILAITFTKKAAAEMKERLQQIIIDKKLPYIGTFHSFAFDILSQEKVIHLVDEGKRKEIIETLLKNAIFAGINKKDADRTISLYKSSAIKDSNNPKSIDTTKEKFVLAYNESLKSLNLFDFDDILLELYELLKKSEKLQSLQNRFQYILVDEFQDTNDVQYEIIKKLFTRSLFVIGDPRQSIYSFRGAAADMFNRVESDFPKAHTVILPTNYRSAQHIVHVSSLLFPEEKKLQPHRKSTGSVRHIISLNENAEAEYIVRSISQHVGGTDLLEAGQITDHTQTLNFSDFAVIYRNHHVSKILKEKLFNSGIPFQAIASESPFQQLEVRFLADFLSFFYDTTDLSASKILEYPFVTSQSQLQSLLEYYKKSSKPSSLIQKLAQHFRLLERLKDSNEELGNLMQFQNSLTQFDNEKKPFEKAHLYLQYLNEREYFDQAADKVTLLTMHASKGLEFRVVFICGVEEGIIPHLHTDTNIEEEKRLFYVALTRAKDKLYLLSSQNRSRKDAAPSRFLNLITCEELVRSEDQATASIKKKIEKAKIKKSQMKMF